MKYTKKCAVVFTYSFDPDCAVTICDSLKDAIAYLKQAFEEELRIETEENKWEVESYHNDDWTYAEIRYGEDTCRYHVANNVLQAEPKDIKAGIENGN
jgi:hypothetical protein